MENQVETKVERVFDSIAGLSSIQERLGHVLDALRGDMPCTEPSVMGSSQTQPAPDNINSINHLLCNGPNIISQKSSDIHDLIQGIEDILLT
jgi:hypothetical protein